MRQKPRILVLDDDQLVTECIAFLVALHMPEVEVQKATVAEDVLRRLTSEHFDLIISDGAEHGAAFVREFIQIAGTTTLIFMSASVSVLQEAQSYGAVHTLSKSGSIPVLIAKIRQLGFGAFIRDLPETTS